VTVSIFYYALKIQTPKDTPLLPAPCLGSRGDSCEDKRLVARASLSPPRPKETPPGRGPLVRDGRGYEKEGGTTVGDRIKKVEEKRSL